jgi:hypothetical protein
MALSLARMKADVSFIVSMLGGAVGLLGGIVALAQSKRSRAVLEEAAERRLRSVVDENAALMAALDAQRDPRSQGLDEVHLTSRDIERRAEKQFRRAGVSDIPPVDYDQMAKRVSLDAYYEALERLYYRTPRNSRILSQYASELTQSARPILLIVDLVNFTETRKRTGTARAGALIEATRKLAFDEATLRGGSILSAIGDSLVIVFDSAVSAFETAKSLANEIASSFAKSDVVARMAIGAVDPMHFNRLQDIYAIEAATSPHAVGIETTLLDELPSIVTAGSQIRSIVSESGRPLQFLEVIVGSV